jgi:ABC-type lipoprotein release transport system permease subunit
MIMDAVMQDFRDALRSLARSPGFRTVAPIVVGIMMGWLATHWARRLAEVQLFQVDTRDPAMLVAAALTVILATLAAAYLHARRAGRLDPAQVLRAE